MNWIAKRRAKKRIKVLTEQLKQVQETERQAYVALESDMQLGREFPVELFSKWWHAKGDADDLRLQVELAKLELMLWATRRLVNGCVGGSLKTAQP